MCKIHPRPSKDNRNIANKNLVKPTQKEKRKRTKVIRQQTNATKEPKSAKIRTIPKIDLKINVLLEDGPKTECFFGREILSQK